MGGQEGGRNVIIFVATDFVDIVDVCSPTFAFIVFDKTALVPGDVRMYVYMYVF